MLSKRKFRVKFRNGIGDPVLAELEQAEITSVYGLMAAEGIDALLGKIPNTNGFVPAFRETLFDARSTIEIRQGERVNVLTRRDQLDANNIRTDLPEIEIAVAKANRGG